MDKISNLFWGAVGGFGSGVFVAGLVNFFNEGYFAQNWLKCAIIGVVVIGLLSVFAGEAFRFFFGAVSFSVGLGVVVCIIVSFFSGRDLSDIIKWGVLIGGGLGALGGLVECIKATVG